MILERDGMRIEHDVDVPMRDGSALKANVFRPLGGGAYPVIVTLGPYGKDLHISGHRKDIWENLVRTEPGILENSSGQYMVFETPDPEVWVPHGYVVVRVDSRGACKSLGRLDVNSPQEFIDFYDAVEWAGVQPWSSGKVGLLGVSYFACGQWMVAAKRPPHLVAIQPWQGTPDFFRGRTRTGGIFCNGFVGFWWDRLVANQHGNAACELKDMLTGERLSGGKEIPEETLRASRADYIAGVLEHPLLDEFYRQRSAEVERIEVPALVVANWGGLGLHLRGTIAGWLGLGSKLKWLKVQTGSYFATFYRPQSVALQRRFFDRFLKGVANGWEEEPRVELEVQSHAGGAQRVLHITDWPAPSTQWQRLHLDAAGSALAASPAAEAQANYEALGEGAVFRTAALKEPLELAGPFRARLTVACDRPDMDLFLTVQAFRPDGEEVTFYTDNEPRQPITQGWLRVTQRHPDAKRSTEWMPWHTHERDEPLVPGEPVVVDVEIWPGSVSLPAGSVLQLRVEGRDFERAGSTGRMRGSGLFTHTHPADRPPERFGGRHTLFTGGAHEAWLQLPVLAG
jgi:predicted acyl esterase